MRERPIPGFEGLYSISDRGVVISSCRRGTDGRAVASHVQSNGYLKVHLYKNCRRRARWVHQLVLEAFVGPRPDGLIACHNDGNPLNNSIENLRWDTPSANYDDARKHGTAAIGDRNPSAKLTARDRAAICAVRPVGKRAPNGLRADLAARYGVSRGTITDVWSRA